MTSSRLATLVLASLAALGAVSGCGRSDFLDYEHTDVEAGDGGTTHGGGPAGGTGFGGTNAGTTFGGTSFGGTNAGTTFGGTSFGGTNAGTTFGGTGFGGTSAGTTFGGTGFGGTGTGGKGGCPGNFIVCNGQCVDWRTNPIHCGQCFNTCADDFVCSNGNCICNGGTNCFGTCTNTSSDPQNCGRCGIVCNSAQMCSGGTCTTACRPPLQQCGALCVNVMNDPAHCGDCNTVCQIRGEVCTNGSCDCPGRQAVCGNRCADLQTDPANCGRCGTACAANQICADGACRLNCPPEFSDCDGECRNLQADPDNCGRCDNSCPRAQVCNGGRCDTSCGNLTSCNGFCRDLQHDPGHCGDCNTACDPDEICQNGTCALVCGPGITNCNGTCRDLRVDPANCGTCGHACASNQICRAGVCGAVAANSYSVSPSPAAFVDACAQPGVFVVVPNVDDGVATMMLPFAFPFYGASMQNAWVSSNGVMGFSTPTNEYANTCSFSALNRAIFAFWDDLVTRQKGVCIATLGAQPNRTLVATWSSAYLLASGTSTDLTFSVQLSESTGIIDVMYGSMVGGTLATGTSATIGLSSDTAVAIDCCQQSCVMSNTGRRYTPVFR